MIFLASQVCRGGCGVQEQGLRSPDERSLLGVNEVKRGEHNAVIGRHSHLYKLV